MASKKGCFIRFLMVFGILLVVLIVLAVSLFLLATGAPVSYPAPGFDGGDKSVVANIITRLARSLVDKDGRVVETAVLQLSRNEVQTLLDAAIVKSDDFKHETLPYAAVWDEGNLHVRYSMPLSASRAANISVVVSPVVDHGQLTLIPGGGSIGHFPLPSKALDFAAKKLTLMAMENDSTRTMLSAFTRIEPGKDGTLLLMFDPRDVNTVVRVLRSAGSPDSVEEPDDDEEEDDDTDEDDEDTDEEDDEEETEE